MSARSRWGVALRGALVLGLVMVLPAVAAEKKAKAAKAPAAKAKVKKAQPVAAPVPKAPRDQAIYACKEHVDRVMRSPNGTTHGPDAQLRVEDKGNEAFLVAGTVAGVREGTHVNAEWECDVTKVGGGLMHTKTKLFLPPN
ncbi:MAG: hypothetical protein ACREQJ_05950 [Candidatus Binatia bacterium]